MLYGFFGLASDSRGVKPRKITMSPPVKSDERTWHNDKSSCTSESLLSSDPMETRRAGKPDGSTWRLNGGESTGLFVQRMRGIDRDAM